MSADPTTAGGIRRPAANAPWATGIAGTGAHSAPGTFAAMPNAEEAISALQGSVARLRAPRRDPRCRPAPHALRTRRSGRSPTRCRTSARPPASCWRGSTPTRPVPSSPTTSPSPSGPSGTRSRPKHRPPTRWLPTASSVNGSRRSLPTNVTVCGFPSGRSSSTSPVSSWRGSTSTSCTRGMSR